MFTLTDGMLLYHGSFTQVPQIDLHKCRQGKDFGRGFYLTSSYQQAQQFVPTSVNKQTTAIPQECLLPVLFSCSPLHLHTNHYLITAPFSGWRDQIISAMFLKTR